MYTFWGVARCRIGNETGSAVIPVASRTRGRPRRPAADTETCPRVDLKTRRGPGRTCFATSVSAILEVLAVLGVIVLIGVAIGAIVTGRPKSGVTEVVPARTATVSDRHRHRWTRWQILDERRIHLYGEVDEGRELPDRIDVVLRRECARCGLPQTQTVRGLDADHRG